MAAAPSKERPTLAGRIFYDIPIGVASLLVVVMIVVGNANTISRWVTGRQWHGSNELLVLLLPATVFLALPAAERAGANVRSTALTDRLPPRAARVVTASGALVSIAITALLVAATGSKAVTATTTGEALVGVRTLPVWPTRIAITVGLAMFVMALLDQLVRALRGEGIVAPSENEPHLEL